MSRILCLALTVSLINQPIFAMDLYRRIDERMRKFSDKWSPRKIFKEENNFTKSSEPPLSNHVDVDMRRDTPSDNFEDDPSKIINEIYESGFNTDEISEPPLSNHVDVDMRHDTPNDNIEDDPSKIIDEIYESGFITAQIFEQIKNLPSLHDTWLFYIANDPILNQTNIWNLLDREKLMLDSRQFVDDFNHSCNEFMLSNQESNFFYNLSRLEKIFGLWGSVRSLDHRTFDDIPAYISVGAPLDHCNSKDPNSNFYPAPAIIAQDQGQYELSIALTKKEYWFLFDPSLLKQQVEKIKSEKYLAAYQMHSLDPEFVHLHQCELFLSTQETKPTKPSNRKERYNKRSSMPALNKRRDIKLANRQTSRRVNPIY